MSRKRKANSIRRHPAGRAEHLARTRAQRDKISEMARERDGEVSLETLEELFKRIFYMPDPPDAA